MTSETLANMQYFLPKEYRYIFFTICSAQLKSNVVFRETGQLPELMFSSSGPLAGKVAGWTKSYKLASLDRDELSALRSVYCTMCIRVTEHVLSWLHFIRSLSRYKLVERSMDPLQARMLVR